MARRLARMQALQSLKPLPLPRACADLHGVVWKCGKDMLPCAALVGGSRVCAAFLPLERSLYSHSHSHLHSLEWVWRVWVCLPTLCSVVHLKALRACRRLAMPCVTWGRQASWQLWSLMLARTACTCV